MGSRGGSEIQSFEDTIFLSGATDTSLDLSSPTGTCVRQEFDTHILGESVRSQGRVEQPHFISLGI